MEYVVGGTLIVLAIWLTVWPMFDATRRGTGAWPWIVGGLLFGPLAGIAYLVSRRAQRMVAERTGEEQRTVGGGDTGKEKTAGQSF